MVNRLNEQMLENASMGGNPIFSGICCIAMAVILIFIELFTLGSVSLYTIFLAIVVVSWGIMLIFMWYNRLNTIKNHIKRYEGQRVPIVKLCYELQEQATSFFRILKELKKKKDLKFEIDDRTGELIVEKTSLSPKPKLLDKEIDNESENKSSENESFIKCPHCGRELKKDYEFCPGCGNKSFKE